MADRPGRVSDELITRFLTGRATDGEPQLLDEIVRAAEASPQTRGWLHLPFELQLRTVALLAALLMVLAAGIAIGSRLAQPDESELDLRMPVIGQVIAAVNTRNVTEVRSLFADDGTVVLFQVESTGDRQDPSAEFDLDVEHFPEAWMGSAEAWGLEAELESCREVDAAHVECQVITRWHTVQVEAVEEWTFQFGNAGIVRLETARLDRQPVDRTLPLKHADLAGWEVWLRTTHPEAAARILDGDPLIWNFFFPYNLDETDFRRLFDEYLRTL